MAARKLGPIQLCKMVTADSLLEWPKLSVWLLVV